MQTKISLNVQVYIVKCPQRLNPWQQKYVRLTEAQPIQHFTCLKLQPGEEDKDMFITDAALLYFSVGLYADFQPDSLPYELRNRQKHITRSQV